MLTRARPTPELPPQHRVLKTRTRARSAACTNPRTAPTTVGRHAPNLPGTIRSMVFLDDSQDHWLTAPTRRDMLHTLLEHLDDEPEDWQLQMIGAACLGHHEPLAIVVTET